MCLQSSCSKVQCMEKPVLICQAHRCTTQALHIDPAAALGLIHLQSTTMVQEHEHPLALSLPPPAPAKVKEEASPCATTTAETERARRRHMSRLYAELGAQLPGGLPPRASKARIVEDAIAYVGELRATVAGLEARAAFARSARTAGGTGAGGGVAWGKTSCFAVRLPEARRRGALTRVLEVFRRHGVHVLAATVTSVDGGEAAVAVTTAPVPPRFLQGIQEDIRSSIA